MIDWLGEPETLGGPETLGEPEPPPFGDADGVRVGSFVRGETVGEPAGMAGQNAGHAPPRSGSCCNVGKEMKVEQLI